MMRKTLMFLGLGLLCIVLSVTLPADGVAQDRGTDQPVADNLGYGLEPGNAVIIIVPEGLDPGDRLESADNWLSPEGRTAVEVTSGASSPADVGTCHRSELPMQTGNFASRSGNEPATEIEFAILYPDNVELPEGVLVGAWREGGLCGPGYQILRGHLLHTEYHP